MSFAAVKLCCPGSARALACSGWRLANRILTWDAIGEGADGDTQGRVCSPEIRRGRSSR
jgi:hypothetical protein